LSQKLFINGCTNIIFIYFLLFVCPPFEASSSSHTLCSNGTLCW